MAWRSAIPPEPCGFDRRALEYGYEDEHDAVCQSDTHHDIYCYPETLFWEYAKIEEVKGHFCRNDSREVNPLVPIVDLGFVSYAKSTPI